MARKRRVWYRGAMYHVMSRGNHKGNIFLDNEDYESYLRILKITKKRYPFILCGYCLMKNHVHLQIKTLEDEIWHIMKHINCLYTRNFNDKYDLLGHLFQGRYNAEIIEDVAYALETSRYIHMNPVKANMVLNPVDYKWSSYGFYMGKANNEIVNKEKILMYFADNVNLYRLFVEGA